MRYLAAILMLACSLSCGYSQSTSPGDLAAFMASLVSSSAASKPLPSAVTTAQVFDMIPEADARALIQAIPQIRLALASPDGDLRRLGLVAVYCIDQRNDSGQLVTPLVPDLLSMMDSDDPQISGLATRSIYAIKPHPPVSVIPRFAAFLGNKQAHNDSGAAVVFALARLAPNDDQAVQAIVQFMQSSDLEPNVRVDTLNALAIPSNTNRSVILGIAEDIQPLQSEEIRLAAFHALQAIGKPALLLTGAQVRRVAEDKREDEKVRTAAQEFLRVE